MEPTVDATLSPFVTVTSSNDGTKTTVRVIFTPSDSAYTALTNKTTTIVYKVYDRMRMTSSVTTHTFTWRDRRPIMSPTPKDGTVFTGVIKLFPYSTVTWDPYNAGAAGTGNY